MKTLGHYQRHDWDVLVVEHDGWYYDITFDGRDDSISIWKDDAVHGVEHGQPMLYSYLDTKIGIIQRCAADHWARIVANPEIALLQVAL